jgi:hypothetical protein
MFSTKHHITLQSIEKALANGEIKSSELRTLLEKQEAKKTISHIKNTSQIITYIGSGLVFLGLIFIGALYWGIFDGVLKTAITLGAGLVLWIMSIFLLKTNIQKSIPISMHFVGSILITGGVGVLIVELIKADTTQYGLFAGILFLICAAFQGIQLLSQRHWASLLSGYAYFLIGIWSFFGYFMNLLANDSSMPVYGLLLVTGSTLLYGAHEIKRNFIHISRLFEIFGSMFLFATAFGIATEHKVLYGSLMIPAVLVGLGFGIIKDRLILIGVSLLWLFFYLQWLNIEYFQNQSQWGLSLIVVGVVLIILYQLSTSATLIKFRKRLQK